MLTKFLDNLSRKQEKIIFGIGVSFFVIAFFISLITFYYKSLEVFLWISFSSILLLFVWIILHVIMKYTWFVEDMMNEYRDNDNIFSGALGVVLLFAVPYVFLKSLAKFTDEGIVQELFNSISSIIPIVLPSFIALLGVNFSLTIQERNRRNDLRLAVKPFFSVKCYTATFDNNRTNSCNEAEIHISMKNISSNIGIPLKVSFWDDDESMTEFRYDPIAAGNSLEKTIKLTTKKLLDANMSLAIYYKDIYENTYKMKVSFQMQKYEDISESKLESDDLVYEKK